MFSLTSWIDVIRRMTPRPIRALSALMIAVVIHTLWRKRTNTSDTENSGLENAPCTETMVKISSSSTSGAGFEGLDQGNESQNKITVQLDSETTTKSRDSSAVVLSEKVFKTKEVSNVFEAGSRKSSRTEVSMNVDNALPEKLVNISTLRPNGIDTDKSRLGKVSCAEETDKEEGYLEQFHNNEILNGIINNNVRTVDSRRNMCFASPCNSSYGEVSNTYTRLIATVGQMLNEYDTTVGLLKKSSKSLIEQRAPDEKSNLPTGCNGSSAELETASVVCKKAPAKDKVDAIWGEFFNLTEELIKKTEASIQRFRVKVLEIVDEDDDGDFVSSKDGFIDDMKSAVESPSSSTQDLCYINENWNGKSEQLAANMAKSKICTKMLPEEVFRTQEVSNDLETSFRESSETDVSTRTALVSDDVMPEKQVTDVNGDSNSNALDLSESLRTEGCQKDQVMINDGANILNYFQRESDGREVESSKLKLIEDAGYVDACDMLLSLTQSLQLSHVVLNGFTFHDYFATFSYYTKLMISNLTPGNCTDKAILDNHSNLSSETNLDKDEKGFDTLGKLKNICKTNTNFKNFVLKEFLKEGFTLNCHIPENNNRHDTLTAGYREPEYQYLLDGTGDSEENQSLLESSFEEPNERTEVCGSGCYTVSSYTLPQEVEGNASISSLDGESEVRIEHDDFEVTTYRVISADLLRYITENSLDFGESKDPFRPSFPYPKVEKKQRGRADSLKFEDSFTVLPKTDSETVKKMNCVVLLQVDPERRPVDTRKPNVKGDGFEPIEDRDDDDDDEKKVEEIDENSSESRKGEYRGEEGSEKNGESSENPGDGQNGGGTGSGGGGGDDKKNGDSEGKNVKDESSEEGGQSDDEDKKNKENAGVSSEKDSNLDEKKGNGGIDTRKNISKDPGLSEVKEIVLATTSLNVDYSTKLMRDALYSYKIKRHVRSTRKMNTPKQFKPLKKKKKGEGEDKDKEGDDGQTEDGNPSGGREEHGEKDRKVKEGESSREIEGAASGSGGGSGSSGGGDDKKKGNDFVRGKVEEEEKESSEEEKNESEDASRPEALRGFTESEPNSGGSTVPESLQAIVGEVRSQASKASGNIDRPTYRHLLGEVVRKTCASREVREEIREFGRNREMQSNPEGGEKCIRLFGKTPASEQHTKSEDVGGNSEGGQVTRSDQRSKEDLGNLPQPAPTSSSDAPPLKNRLWNIMLDSNTRPSTFDGFPPIQIPTSEAEQPDIEQTGVQIGSDNQSVDQKSFRSSDSRTPKKGKAAAEEGDGSRKLKYPQGPTEPKRPKNVKDVAVSAAQGSKSPSKAKKSPIKSSERGKELSTEPKRPKKAEDAAVSPAKGSKSPSKAKKSPIKSSDRGKELSMEPKRLKKAEDAAISPAKCSKSPSKAKKSPIKSSERGKELSTEPKRPKKAAVSPSKGSKTPKASKPKEAAIESSECEREKSTELESPKDKWDALVLKIASENLKEPQRAPEVHTLTFKREYGKWKPKKPKDAEEAAAPKPKEGNPDHVVFGETLVPLSEINVGASCSYLPPTEEAERPLTPPIPRPSSPSHFASSTSSLDHSREPADLRYHATAPWGPHGVTGPFYEGYLSSLDYTFSDDDIYSFSDENVHLEPYHAPPNPPEEFPQDPHSRPENVDEMQEQNPGPLDLSKKN